MIWPVRILRRAFVGASVAWFSALPLATFASSRPYPPSLVYLLSFGTYLVGGFLCHQRPERSFFLWGSQMPVCARCTGIYFAAALGAIVWSARRSEPSSRAWSDVSSGHAARGWLIAAALPTIVTLLYEWATGDTPANWIRALAGLPIGIVAAWIVLSVYPRAAEGMR
jgi:uncharacterized membrane protein